MIPLEAQPSTHKAGVQQLDFIRPLCLLREATVRFEDRGHCSLAGSQTRMLTAALLMPGRQ